MDGPSAGPTPRPRLRRAVCTLGVALVAGAIAPAAAPASGLIAAFDRYETGRGFEIGLVNAGTGAPIALPASVNTADDELHPALSVDGRYLLFDRMRLVPKLNGDIVAPAERTVRLLDRQTGAITTLETGSGAAAGATFVHGSERDVAWGVRPASATCCVAKYEQLAADNTISGSSGFDLHLSSPPAGQVLDVPHVAMDRPPNLFNIYLSRVYSDPNTGALLNGAVTLFGSRSNGDGTFAELRTDFGTPDAPASHPVARRDDQYVALDRTRGSDADIQTISFPGEAQLTSAPAPITTSAPERMPAWSPGGLQLGFVRTSGGTRKLAIFDLTPGLQTIVNPPIDIGAEPPTAQTRAFQNSWGGLSLAQDVGVRLPTVTCDTSCVSPLQTTLSAVVLSPTVSTTTKTQTIGIFVARVTGRRHVLGRSLPRIKPVGRVPLGATRKGGNHFRWNGTVNGRRLKAGRYLLTYRALRRGRVVSTSRSIRFTVTKGRRIRAARLLP